jgi:hypothetical protein
MQTNEQIKAAIIEISGSDWDGEVLTAAVEAVKSGDKQYLIDQAADSDEADKLIALIGWTTVPMQARRLHPRAPY